VQRLLIQALAFAALAVLAAPAQVRADEARDLANELSIAAEALKEGEFARAAEIAGALANTVGGAIAPGLDLEPPRSVSRQDRAEIWRILGLARFFKGDLDGAEQALLEYLKLEQDARLDPALVPPEAIVFLEDVRSRHAAEIRAYHPDPTPRRWALLNLVPPAGQFQNADRRVGFTLAVSGAALVGLNIGTYAWLKSVCSSAQGNVCGDEGQHYGRARFLRAVNVGSLVGLGVVYVYGVYDGFSGYRSRGRELSLSLAPGGFPGVAVRGRF
jgi:hypothetical protein